MKVQAEHEQDTEYEVLWTVRHFFFFFCTVNLEVGYMLLVWSCTDEKFTDTRNKSTVSERKVMNGKRSIVEHL